MNKMWSETSSTIGLAQALVRLDTVNPPGNETVAAELIAARLRAVGAQVELIPLDAGRDNLIARIGDRSRPAICFCGHLDTVPLGTRPWSRHPLSGDIADGKLWGRGSTDMKGGVAAMVTAFERIASSGSDVPVVLVLCASEETGCQGAASVAGRVGNVGAMVIAEPTSGAVAIGHKGVAWLKLIVRGKAAHGSMPHLGINAIELMAEAVGRLKTMQLPVSAHPLLGSPSVNIGTISGGAATNIVPDLCELTLDVRLVPGLPATDVIEFVRSCVGPDISVEPVLALDAVASSAQDPFVAMVLGLAGGAAATPVEPISVSYFTDASVLTSALGNPPTVILGPGDAALAHQVDESCSLRAIDAASELYEKIALSWANLQKNELRGTGP